MPDVEKPEGAAEAPAPEEGFISSQLAEVGSVNFEVLLKLDSMGLLREDSLKRVVTAVCFYDPDVFLSHEKMVRFCPELIETAVRELLAKNPDNIFEHIKLFADQPWAREVLLTAVQHGEQGGKLGNEIFDHIELVANQPWAEEILLTAVQNDGAWGAFNYAQKLVGLPFGEKILRAAAPLNMWAAINFADRYKSAPFARDLLVDLVSRPFRTVHRERAPLCGTRLMLTIRNGTPIAPYDVEALASLPFAVDIFRALATANPDWVKENPYAFRNFPGAREIFERLGLDPVTIGCHA